MTLLLASPALRAEGDKRAHRAAGERAEKLGKYREAAREYAQAYAEESDPELLYRMGVCRRRLKLYSSARDAFRAYLREAPSGALKDDAERQLAQLDVLVDEQKRAAPDSNDDEPRPTRKPRRAAEATPMPPPPEAKPPPPATPPPEVKTPPAVATLAPEPEKKPLALELPPPQPRSPAAEALAIPDAPSRRVAPYVVGGASLAVAAAGAFLWWDGARASRDLDARFNSSSLTAADAPRYSRARAESIGGRALVGVSVIGAAAAVYWMLH